MTFRMRFVAMAAASGLAAVLALGQAVHAQHDHAHDSAAVDTEAKIGAVNFRVDCDDGVVEDFDRALAMLHHMMYEQARGQFAAIAEADPDCAMAYWGVATTLFQPLWGTRPPEADLKRGWSKSKKAAERAESEREQALIKATAAFFRDPETADYATRQERWANAMKAAYEAEPDDEDIAALFALSRLALAQVADDPNPLHDKAEEVLRAVHARNSTHPGAIHYLIHSDDIDGRAERNLEIVETYGEIAPNVAHALHMPSHIHVRLGNWPEVIEWNRRSAQAALEHPAGDHVSLHYPHAQDYMVYAHLQRGEDGAAGRELEATFEHGEMQHHPGVAFPVAAMPARIAVEQRDWARAAELPVREPDYLPWDEPMGLWAESLTWLARGLGAVHTGDSDGAEKARSRIAELRQTALERGERRFADYIHIEELILAGWIAKAEGEAEKAVALVREAAEVEARVEKHPITPGALLPPNEALGDLLVELGRPEDALAAYRASDAIWPGRYNTLLGAGRAAELAGDDRAAKQWYARLVEVAPDSERPTIEQARELAVM